MAKNPFSSNLRHLAQDRSTESLKKKEIETINRALINFLKIKKC